MRAPLFTRPSTRLIARMSHGDSLITLSPRIQPRLLCIAHRRGFKTGPALTATRASSRPRVANNKGPIFTRDDVPPLEFWREAAPRPLLGHLTPEDCHKFTQVYCDLTIEQRSDWKNKLKDEYNISPETLHHLATILVGGVPSPVLSVGLQMLATASELGSDLSTTLLIRLMLRGENPDRLAQSALFRHAVARFQYMVRQKRDPDAMTLQGFILSRQDEDDKALEYFDQAIRLSMPQSEHAVGDEFRSTESHPQTQIRSPRWPMEPTCHTVRGEILLRQGRREEAESAMRIAALELDHPNGYLGLAKALPEDAPDRTRYLQIAAVSGKAEACRLLGETELGLAKQPGLRSGEARVHNLWATEWFSLADDHGKAAEARWAYAK